MIFQILNPIFKNRLCALCMDKSFKKIENGSKVVSGRWKFNSDEILNVGQYTRAAFFVPDDIKENRNYDFSNFTVTRDTGGSSGSIGGSSGVAALAAVRSPVPKSLF